MGNAWACSQFKLENKIKKYSYACDCMALARKVKCILDQLQLISFQRIE